MDGLLSGLALAAVSGLTFVAYKHPDGYKRLITPIRILLPALFIAAVIWDISSSRTVTRLHDFIQPGKILDARSAIEAGDILNGYRVLAYILGMLYLEFLTWLPQILGEQKPPKE